jgi:hypothetical protein
MNIDIPDQEEGDDNIRDGENNRRDAITTTYVSYSSRSSNAKGTYTYRKELAIRKAEDMAGKTTSM